MIDPFENIKYDVEKKYWVQSFSGRKIDLLDTAIDSIVIEDIAHSLSMLCRFKGHSKQFYSVAQHSVIVSYICEPQYSFYGLLHDASEYVLGDMPAPLKRSGKINEYKKIEKILQGKIYNRFGLKDDEPDDIKRADLLALSTEAYNFMNPLHPDWKNIYNPLDIDIVALPPADAETLFLSRFDQLFGKQNG